jgi:DNA-binding Xre family transcriptional regulator
MYLHWALREVAFARGIVKTTDLWRALGEYGIDLSRPQAYRLMAETPERLSLPVLTALCAVLECDPNDLLVKTDGSPPRAPRLRAVDSDLAQ